MTDYEARIYDLDGTLVRLAVDWGRVSEDVRSVYGDAGIEPPDDAGLWDLMAGADEHGIGDAVEETIARHEREGAADSARLPAADALASLSVPVAVCSLNSEAACRIALETHDLGRFVDAVVGRDSVDSHKPDPGPLLAAAGALSVDPADVLFVGDTDTDERAAERAGMPFAYVDPPS